MATDSLPLYLEDFWVSSIKLEAELNQRRFGENIKVTGNLYNRINNSPDPLRFGFNQFKEYKLEGSLEFVPLLNHDFFRIVLRGGKTLGDRDSLMFYSDAPDLKKLDRSKIPNLQIILRLAF